MLICGITKDIYANNQSLTKLHNLFIVVAKVSLELAVFTFFLRILSALASRVQTLRIAYTGEKINFPLIIFRN